MTPDEFIELPCPETNSYKVGDYVRVYEDVATGTVATVTEIRHDLLVVNFGDSLYRVHYKACRPLKKKEKPKPRTFWIHPEEFMGALVARDSTPNSGDTREWVRVQDRCHACGEDFNK